MARFSPPARKVKLGPLVATMFFIVSGGAFGLEDLLKDYGAWASCVVLLVTPILWSVPTALLVGELAAALPEEGGYYAWVRRGLGPFWGFQEAWLSLAASVFDMAIYPTLFVSYAARLAPVVGTAPWSTIVGVVFIAACALWNLRGAAVVGEASRAQSFVVIGPFVVLAALCVVAAATGRAPSAAHAPATIDPLGGLLVAMWNFMGWDNAATFAREVEAPQRTYPRAVLFAVTLVVACYLVPVIGVGLAHVDTTGWEEGAWATLARDLGGPWLGVVVVVAGCASALTMFNSLALSYSRIPVAMAEDGLLPAVFGKQLAKSAAPHVSILACAFVWTLTLGLSFERLVMLDILLYGLSLVLEFAALAALRQKEPSLARPFKVPGGLAGIAAIATPPAILIALSVVRNHDEKLPNGWNALALGGAVVAAGPLLFLVARRRKAV